MRGMRGRGVVASVSHVRRHRAGEGRSGQHRHTDTRHHQDVPIQRRPGWQPTVRKEGTPQNIYVKWIKGQLDREAACLELPFTMLLFISFAILSLAYVGQETMTMMQQGISTDIELNANYGWSGNFGHKVLEDVANYADFWSWYRTGLLSWVFQQVPYSWSEDLLASVPLQPNRSAYSMDALPTRIPIAGYRQPAPIRNDYMFYNRIIGGFRLRQQVASASDDLCNLPMGDVSLFKAYIGKHCSDRTDQELPPDLYAAESMTNFEREEWFLADTEPWVTLQQRALDMEDGCSSAATNNRTCLCSWCREQDPMNPWLNELTARVELAFVVYNAQYGVYSLATTNLWFNRAGHIHKRVNVRSSWAGISIRETGVLLAFLGAGFVWLLGNIYVFRSESREIVDLIRRSKKPWFLAIIDDYVGFWNTVDWVSLLIALIIGGIFVALNVKINDANTAFANIAMKVAYNVTVSMDEHLVDIRSFYGSIQDMFDEERSFRFWLCIYPLVLMMRLFKSFAAQPRLAVVTETFKVAASDMLHFFIVFTSVYFCMAVNAVLFFGQDMLSFSQIDWALFACYRAMLGEWDWEAMSGIGRAKAFLWFFLFMLVMVLVLMNILVSILMESYATVKTNAENADSLWTQILNLLRRVRETRQGKRVRLNDIQETLLEDADGDIHAMFSNKRLLLPIFRVILDRTTGHDLGLELDASLGILLVTKVVPGGLADKWNILNNNLEVRRGDEVVEVNGLRDETSEMMMAALQKEEVLKIRLRRTDRFNVEEGAPRLVAGKSKSQVLTKTKTVSTVFSGRTGAKAKNPRDAAFLMDMVKGVPETQAKRTLKNAQDEEDKMNGVGFAIEDLQDDMKRMLERVENSLLCAGWVAHKFKEYEAELGEKAAPRTDVGRVVSGDADEEKQKVVPSSPSAPKKRPVELSESFRDGLAEVRLVAEERTTELADDVAAVLGEEMRGLERRQREQQRVMSHAQESLQGLRQLVFKLDLTCDEVGLLTNRVFEDADQAPKMVATKSDAPKSEAEVAKSESPSRPVFGGSVYKRKGSNQRKYVSGT